VPAAQDTAMANFEAPRTRNRRCFLKRIAVLLSLCFLTIPSISAGEENWTWRDSSSVKVDGKTSMKSKDGFGSQLLITNDKDYLKKWKQPTGPFHLHTVKSALRDQPMFILIVFANPGVDKEGLCDISADFTVIDPHGKLYGDIKDKNCWQKMPPPPVGNIQLSKAAMRIVIRKEDASGKYLVNAIVKDHVKGTELKLSDYFDVA